MTGDCIEHSQRSRKYGNTHRNGKKICLHQLAFLERHGYLPPVVMHSCDNPRCINPDHLVAGTHKQNSVDMARRKRAPGQKLDPKDYPEIRRLWHSGMSQTLIAARYGVSQTIISKAIRRTYD